MIPTKVQEEMQKCRKGISKAKETLVGVRRACRLLNAEEHRLLVLLTNLEDQQSYLREGRLCTLQDMKDRGRRDVISEFS